MRTTLKGPLYTESMSRERHMIFLSFPSIPLITDDKIRGSIFIDIVYQYNIYVRELLNAFEIIEFPLLSTTKSRVQIPHKVINSQD